MDKLEGRCADHLMILEICDIDLYEQFGTKANIILENIQCHEHLISEHQASLKQFFISLNFN